MASSHHASQAPGQSATTHSPGGAPAFAQPSVPASASEPMSADEELRQDWMLFDRPDGYDAASEQETRDLADY